MDATTLKLSLHDAGMTAIHRAGLGGLVASLRWIEEHVSEPERPPGQWSVEPYAVTLSWDKPEGARPFFERLFTLSFQLRDGIIYLPGQYADADPPPALLAEIQNGLLLTFLQHGLTRKSNGNATVQYQINDIPMSVTHLVLTQFAHRAAYEDLLTGNRLSSKEAEVSGAFLPGAAVRHNAFAAPTKIKEPPTGMLCLAFAIVGCLALRIARRSVGVLVVPHFDNLADFAEMRPYLTPRSPRECMVASPGDAAMQAALRLRLARIEKLGGLRGCDCVTMRALPWATQQKSRAGILWTQDAISMPLHDFQTALDCLPDRVVMPKAKSKTEEDGVADAVGSTSKKGRGNKAGAAKPPPQPFVAPSAIRPLIADNLATGRPWFENFVRLCIPKDQFEALGYEQKGLHEMTDKIAWASESQATLVRAVHEAMYRRYGAIAGESSGGPATKNRMKNERARLRLAFAGAKKHEAFRFALTDLFSRAGVLSELQEGWEGILPLLGEARWKECRDLALLALASYRRPGPADTEQGPEVDDASSAETNAD